MSRQKSPVSRYLSVHPNTIAAGWSRSRDGVSGYRYPSQPATPATITEWRRASFPVDRRRPASSSPQLLDLLMDTDSAGPHTWTQRRFMLSFRPIVALAVCVYLGMSHGAGSPGLANRTEADRASEQGQCDRAVELYTNLLAKDSRAESRGKLWRLGLCQKQLGQYRAAIETFERILHAGSFDSSTRRRVRYLSEAQWEIWAPERPGVSAPFDAAPREQLAVCSWDSQAPLATGASRILSRRRSRTFCTALPGKTFPLGPGVTCGTPN